MDIREFLKTRGPLIFDGAMGTYFAAKTGSAAEKCELGNLSHRQVILDIHREYIEAGCRAVKTNTFAANSGGLDADASLLRQVIAEGFAVAAEAAEGRDVFVFADMGPIPRTEQNERAAEYIALADLFLSLGARHFLFETLSSDAGIAEAARHIKARAPDAYIIASFALQPDGYTREGFLGQDLFARASRVPEIDAAGFNCMSGAHHLLSYIRTLDIKGVALSVMPNAGYPTVIRNRTFYTSEPAYFAEQMAGVAACGALILGGCCGTTPLHMKKTVEAVTAAPKAPSPPLPQEKAALPKEEKQPLSDNRFWQKVLSGRPVVAVELDPPAVPDLAAFMDGAKALKNAGADLITIADCPMGRARVDSSLLACKLTRELDIDALPHLTCRDRNLNATKALLLGLHLEGIRNILAVTGDPIPSADRDEVKSVFNFNSRMLARYISVLNESVFPSPFQVFGALNVNALNFTVQLRLAREKMENGVSMFFTQPVLTGRAFENLKRAKKELDARILGGIIPIVSHRNACFLHNEVSGIKISGAIIALYEGKNREEAAETAVSLSTAIAKEIAPYVDGYYLMTPFLRVGILSQIMKNIRDFQAAKDGENAAIPSALPFLS